MRWAREIWPSPFLFLVSVKRKMWRLLPFGGSKSSKFPLRGNAFRIDLPIYIHEHWIPPLLPFHFPLYMYVHKCCSGDYQLHITPTYAVLLCWSIVVVGFIAGQKIDLCMGNFKNLIKNPVLIYVPTINIVHITKT